MTENTALGGSSDAGAGANAGTGGGTGAVGAGGATGGVADSKSSGLGGGDKSWRDSLPDDLKSHGAVSSFKDVESLTRSFIETKSLVGKKGVIVPGEKATSEQWSAFYKDIGVPDADKYEVVGPKDFKVDPTFKAECQKNGLLPKQASELLNWNIKREQGLEAAKKAETKALVDRNMATLKAEWGDAFEKEMGGARLAVKELGGDALLEHLNKTGMGNDINLIKVFAKAAKLFSEDKLREGGVSRGGDTVDEIKSQLEEARGNVMSLDKHDPRRPAAFAKFESLAKRLTGGQ